MTQTMLEKKQEAEEFYKEAFCVEKAEMIFNKELSDFHTVGLIKLTTHENDKRQDFYVALLKEND